LYGVWSSPAFPPTLGFFFQGFEEPFCEPKGEATVAKPIRKKDAKRRVTKDEHLPLARENFVIIGAGLAVIVAGYLAMLEGSVEGFLPLVVSPILLVLGYCVIVPIGILYRKPYLVKKPGAPEQPVRQA
jgi:hypothetical protein